MAGQKADFVYGYFFGGDTLRFVRQYKSFGLKFPLVMTPSSLSAASVAQALGENVKGVYSTELWDMDARRSRDQEIRRRLQTKFGHPPQTLAYDGYIKAKVMFEAIKSLNGRIAEPNGAGKGD